MKNNYKNKEIKKQQFKKSIRTRRKRALKAELVYPYDVYVNFWIKYTSEGTNRNYSIDIKEMLLNDHYFSTLATLYQTFALQYTEVVVSAREVNGTMPPAGYIIYLVDGDADTGLSYADIPNTQGTKYLSNRRTTKLTYSRSGRQPDTGYWYDTMFTGEANMSQKIKIRLDEDLRQDIGYYYGRLRFRVLFKRPKRNVTNKTELKQQKEDEKKVLIANTNEALPEEASLIESLE